jgi:hypothetical protein
VAKDAPGKLSKDEIVSLATQGLALVHHINQHEQMFIMDQWDDSHCKEYIFGLFPCLIDFFFSMCPDPNNSELRNTLIGLRPARRSFRVMENWHAMVLVDAMPKHVSFAEKVLYLSKSPR